MRSSSFGEDLIWLTPNQNSPSQRRASGFESIWGNSGNTGSGPGSGGGGPGRPENSSGSNSGRNSGANSGGNSVSSASGNGHATMGNGGSGPAGPNGNNSSNIWSMNRSSGLGSGDFVPQMPNLLNRNSFGGQPFSPQSPQVDFENQYGFNLRRHSYGDVYNHGAGNKASSQGMMQSLPTNPNLLQEDGTMDLVNEYFEKDPHERVRVTVSLLNERYFDEEKYLGDSYQLPKFPIENSLRNYQLVLVGFKAGRVDVFYLPAANEVSSLKIGDLVVVEADRGRDLGKIFKMNISIDEARLMKLLQFQEQQAALSESDVVADLSVKNMNFQTSSVSPPTLHFPKPILSLAQPNDILQILNKKQDEEKACRLCLAKIANITNSSTNEMSPTGSGTTNSLDLLQMKLIDAEYQFDRKKLIFYYSTHKRIDFRDLVRELFRIYKTRIWMCAVVGIPYSPGQGLQNATSPILNNSNLGNEGYQAKLMVGGQGYNQYNMPHDQSMAGPFHNFVPGPGPGQGMGPRQGSGGPFQFQEHFNQSAPATAGGPGPRAGLMSGPVPGPGSMPGPGGQFQFQERFNQPAPQNIGPGPAPGQMPVLNDPFRPPMMQGSYNAERRLSFQGPYEDYDRRMSMQNYNGEIPRKFLNDGEKEQDSRNESFVLKSLVDSINH